MKKTISTIISIIITAILIGIIIFVYKRFYFNDFTKAQDKSNVTSFYRDSKEKTNEYSSYCIDSKDYNDAIFLKEIAVEKDTPYKVTCMVKTENVESTIPETSGACISLVDSADQSTTLQGTNDWQKITLLFDSKNQEKVRIGFRLGGYNGYSKGKVWFSDIHVEKGKKDDSKEWNVVCFFINNVDFNIKGTRHEYSLTQEDKDLLEANLNRFDNTCEIFSNNEMVVNHEIIEIDEPLTNFSYDDENYYYVAPEDVRPLIDKYVQEKEYDHIFIGIRMGNTSSEIPVKDWIGLGSMRYESIGFSNIRMPNNLKNSTMYKYDIKNDTFPEEVFVHEFLHSLERNAKERGYTIPALHDNEKFGYENVSKKGLKNWYIDYMQCNIDSNQGKVGIDKFIYTTKPVHLSDFSNATEIEFETNPKNVIDAITQVFKNLKNILIKSKDENTEFYDYNTSVTTD